MNDPQDQTRRIEQLSEGMLILQDALNHLRGELLATQTAARYLARTLAKANPGLATPYRAALDQTLVGGALADAPEKTRQGVRAAIERLSRIDTRTA